MFSPFPSPQPSPVSTSVFTSQSLDTACGDEQFVCLSLPASLSQGLLTRGSCWLEPVGFMKSNAVHVLSGGASMVSVRAVVLC